MKSVMRVGCLPDVDDLELMHSFEFEIFISPPDDIFEELIREIGAQRGS